MTPRRAKPAPSYLYAFMGLPCSGKGTVAAQMKELATRTYIDIMSCSAVVRDLMTPEAEQQMRDGGLFPLENELRGELAYRVRKKYADGADVIILDGCPRFPDQVLWLENEFFDKNPTYIHVRPSSIKCLWDRAQTRARDEFDTNKDLFDKRVTRQLAHLTGIESLLHQMGLQYRAVTNDIPERAAREIMAAFPAPKRKR